jgi:hypothetical protein
VGKGQVQRRVLVQEPVTLLAPSVALMVVLVPWLDVRVAWDVEDSQQGS